MYRSILFLISFSMIAGIAMGTTTKPYTNRLINEKSPYLLQHAHNPVDWYPWGDEAFEKAKKENKPVFLSIGYSTCHWCHVMERESFTNPDIAKILNDNFVSIKVDREERPDIDNVYMGAVVAMTGRGGWPLSVFLTPDKKPFYGGTYFPPEDRFGMPGFKRLLTSIAESWKNRQEEIRHSSSEIIAALIKQNATRPAEEIRIDETLLQDAYKNLLTTFDSQYSGFGSAPKFPPAHSLSFLLRYWHRTGDARALRMVERTLSTMARSGMYDHIGGGFHRYATDRQWRVPHFEKMLYDQALLAQAYLEAYQITKKEGYARYAREILDYVLRDLISPEGAFYTAEDADSMPAEHAKEGSSESTGTHHAKKEGAFYVWTKEEIFSVLGEDGDIFCFHFGVREGGNAPTDPHGEFRGKNILYEAEKLKETSRKFQRAPEEIVSILDRSKKKLFAERMKRPRPHLDDKILTDWNGLVIASFAYASRVLDDPRYKRAALKAARFILSHCVTKEGRLLHRYRDEEAAIQGTIDDYAFFIYGLLNLYEATFDVDYLAHAKRLADEMIAHYWDVDDGGFFLTAEDAEPLPIRSKELYDGSVPSGNSVAAYDLARLSRYTMNAEYTEKVHELLKAFWNNVTAAPIAYPRLLLAYDFVLGPTQEIVISALRNDETAQRMLTIINEHYLPNAILTFRAPDKESLTKLIEYVPFTVNQAPLNDKATVYVCEGYTCKEPVTELQELLRLLKKRPKK